MDVLLDIELRLAQDRFNGILIDHHLSSFGNETLHSVAFFGAHNKPR
jgi:hypothetical protein